MGVLNGKAVVVTGAGSGIGAGCAKGTAAQGASVIVNDINPTGAQATVDAITKAGGTAVVCIADISQWEEAGRLIDTCIKTFGKIDELVNNAALIHVGTIKEFDPKAARKLVDVNVLGTLHCAAQAVKPMLEQKSGSIVNVTSGAHMGMPTLGIYGATKGASASMIYTWALELAGSGVRVNGLSPFAAGTGMVRPNVTDEERKKSEFLTQRPEHNSPVVEFLLSDLAKDVNGQIVRIDLEEVCLYTHPSLLMPAAVRKKWTAEDVADAFANEFKDRQVGCGVLGMDTLPHKLRTGFWARREVAGV